MIKLRVGIAAAFALVMVPLTGGMVGYLYHSNSELMLETASLEMERATNNVQRDLKGMLDPVRQVVSATAELVRTDFNRIANAQGTGYFHRQLEELPQVFSIYSGFEGQGDFYQVFHIPKDLRALGPWKKPLDEDVNYAVRYIRNTSGERSDSYIFYRDWGNIAHVERTKAVYDPRVRPWYKASSTCDDVVFSDAYVFSSSKLVGLTLSQRITTDTGVLIGVAGADVTLDSLSAFLRRSQIGEKGRVFILDQTGHLIGHPDPRMGVRVDEDKVKLLHASEVKDLVVAQAVRLWEDNKKKSFEFTYSPKHDDYMASFTRMPIGDGRFWTVGVMVDKNELIGPIKQATFNILILGLCVISLSMLAIVKLSKMLTDPIKAIVAKTDRLKMFDLEGDLETSSRIKEVYQLTTAVETMTRSLRSFSVYVPRELVRSIVSGGSLADLNPRRQAMTVMMSDIAGYTKATENQPPERVVQLLNTYFDGMTGDIHAHRGIVDKYIGDAIMAIWNAPTYDPLHVENACRAVLACKKRSEALVEEFRAQGEAPYVTRFGLHSGEAVVGNVGSSDRKQYSAIGDMVNLTSRLEALNKMYGTTILITEDIAHQIMLQFVVRCMDRVLPCGISHPVMIYELIAERRDLEENGQYEDVKAMCESWQTALQLYFAGQWLEAIATFGLHKQAYPNDPASDVFIARCKAYQKNPPPEDWGGAQKLECK